MPKSDYQPYEYALVRHLEIWSLPKVCGEVRDDRIGGIRSRPFDGGCRNEFITVLMKKRCMSNKLAFTNRR
eukprot:scaffold206_cov147-Skeletonema_marinoi.AAC.8